MVTDVLKLLTYFAGCTERVEMGTMVIVLPWHDPVRVAEGIAALDNMLGGRRLSIGFGRGLGRRDEDRRSCIPGFRLWQPARHPRGRHLRDDISAPVIAVIAAMAGVRAGICMMAVPTWIFSV